MDRCRRLDYRIRGYRPPQSRWTADLTEETLCYHNFEWLATSRHALGGATHPWLERRIVKIPIAIADDPLYRDGMSYADWESTLLATIDGSDFTAVSLHDCYGDFWIAQYPRLLAALQARGVLRTFDAVADDTIVASAAPGTAA